MPESEIVSNFDGRLWQRVAAENVSNVVICTECSSLVYNTVLSRDHHVAWHKRLLSDVAPQGD
jgi:hypothetical protein